MKLEDHVCTLEQAKRFKELGVNQNSLFYWKENDIQNVVTESRMKEWIEKYLPLINDYYSMIRAYQSVFNVLADFKR